MEVVKAHIKTLGKLKSNLVFFVVIFIIQIDIIVNLAYV